MAKRKREQIMGIDVPWTDEDEAALQGAFAPYTQPLRPIEDIDQTLVWLLRRMMDEWGAAGVKNAVDAIVAAQQYDGEGA